jgi:hypothetical protein
MNAVSYIAVSPYVFFIGVPRTAKGRDKAKLVNIAAVMEYGATIKPRHAQALAVPVSRNAKNLVKRYGSIRDIPDLVHPKGSRVLGRAFKRKFVILFILMSESVIPPRPFIETTYREQRPKILLTWRRASIMTMRGKRFVA